MTIPLRNLYLCENCQHTFDREIYGMTCPVCAGNQVRPMANWICVIDSGGKVFQSVLIDPAILGETLEVEIQPKIEQDIINDHWINGYARAGTPNPRYARLDASLAKRAERQKLLRAAFGPCAKIRQMMI